MISTKIPPVFIPIISQHTHISTQQVTNTLHLLVENATIPFISRYRKEATGNLNEIQIAEVKDWFDTLNELQTRKTTIIHTIQSLNLLTPELRQRIDECWDETILEDIYLPYKPKRKTKADIAKESGLEPLAKMIMKQQLDNPYDLAKKFLTVQLTSIDDVIQGASYIIAEWINENEAARNIVRRSFQWDGIIKTSLIKGKEEEGQKYKDYFQLTEKLSKCASHRLLAIRRAETEGYIRVNITPDEALCLTKLENLFCKSNNSASEIVYNAVKDAYKRLLKPSIETEFAASSKFKADVEAIKVFASNLQQLLMASPLGEKRILAIDPGYRTGCKLVCLDKHGNLLHNETIFPHAPQHETQNAIRKLQKLVEAYRIQAIAIGNGTASRETEQLLQKIRFDNEVQVFVVSENGASIYSASKVAREEFPDFDVTVRGAISIGRRLMDPLAELVKIEPKSIGVGQYQHDVNQNLLKKTLDQTVVNVVNRVGVNVNTASKHLLSYVSGIGPQLAQNIVNFRLANGAFTHRKQLLQVDKLGPKSFEQCAGFLRIPSSKHPLDNTSIHPESYHVVEKMAADLQTDLEGLLHNKNLIQKIDLNQYITDTIGLLTISDILLELEKPGRDLRTSPKILVFDDKIKKLEDLVVGMELSGIVTNITNFGAFVDIGIKENGLIHISRMTENFVSNPSEIVTLHEHVRVLVENIDLERRRIQLKLLK